MKLLFLLYENLEKVTYFACALGMLALDMEYLNFDDWGAFWNSIIETHCTSYNWLASTF